MEMTVYDEVTEKEHTLEVNYFPGYAGDLVNPPFQAELELESGDEEVFSRNYDQLKRRINKMRDEDRQRQRDEAYELAHQDD